MEYVIYRKLLYLNIFEQGEASVIVLRQVALLN